MDSRSLLPAPAVCVPLLLGGALDVELDAEEEEVEVKLARDELTVVGRGGGGVDGKATEDAGAEEEVGGSVEVVVAGGGAGEELVAGGGCKRAARRVALGELV
jgi:hypothetical protein